MKALEKFPNYGFWIYSAESYDGSVIQNGVKNVLSKSKAAGVLRLVFHDAGTFDIGDKSG